MPQYDSNTDHAEGVSLYDTCRRVPYEMLMQSQVWVDAAHQLRPINLISDGHLDNLIKWLEEHNGHWVHSFLPPSPKLPLDVHKSPLYIALVKEQKRRIPFRNLTPRQALKDLILNDNVVFVDSARSTSKNVDKFISAVIAGLDKREFEITKKVKK